MEFYQEFLFTAVLSVLLVFLLGKIFSIGDGNGDGNEDNREAGPTKIAGERRGNDSLGTSQVDDKDRHGSEKKCEEEKGFGVHDKDRHGSEDKCEEEKGFGVDEVRSDLISANESPDELEIERYGGDLVNVGISEARGIRVDDLESKFEASAAVDNSLREMPELEVSECSEEAKKLKFGLEKELDAARIETRLETSEVRVGSPFVKKEEELDDLETRLEASAAGDNSVREVRETKESERLAEGKEIRFGLSEAKVERHDVFLVKEDEWERDVSGSRGEKTVPKEGSEGEKRGNDEKGQSLLSEEDEWEGIERTELEKHFRVASAYVGSEGGEFALPSLSDDEQMQLYGLHKVATEGPCYDPQPMALKVSARAKWHAWQRLGNMNPDAAMEQYMNLLFEKIPGWIGEKPQAHVEKHKESDVAEAALSGTCAPEVCSDMHSQLGTKTERIQECPSCVNEDMESAIAEHNGQGSTSAK